MPRHGQDRPRHGRAQVRLQDVQDIFHRREAQRRGHRIDDGVEAVVEGRMVPCGEAHGQELGQLLAAGNDHEVVQQQIPHGRAPQRRARRPRQQQLRQRRRNGNQRPEQNELAQQPPRLLFDMIELIDADEQNRRRDQRRERQIIIQFHVRLPLFTSVERTSAIARAGCADRGARGGTAHT